MRSTRVSSWPRLVMTAETCGMSAMPAKVAPPLKSTRTKLSCSEECVIASARTRVRSSSDLPEPVAPMTSPCGPMPCWADSLMSRATTWPLAAHPDRHAEPVALEPWPPGGGRVEVAHVAETEEVDELGAGGECVAHLDLTADEHRGEATCGGLGLGHAHLVREAPGPATAEAEDLERDLTGRHTLSGRVDRESQGGGRVELAPLLGQVEHGDPEHPVVGDERVVARETGAVDDDEHVRGGRLAARPEPRPVGDVLGQQLEQLVDRLGDEAHRADGIAFARAERVRQPLEPVPLLARVRPGEGGDDERVGRVHERGVDDERAGERPGRTGLAGDLDARPGRQRDRRREPVLHAVGREQAVQSRGRDRVELGQRRGLGGFEGEAQRLRRRAHADVEEVLVLGQALPDAALLLGEQGERRRARGSSTGPPRAAWPRRHARCRGPRRGRRGTHDGWR